MNFLEELTYGRVDLYFGALLIGMFLLYFVIRFAVRAGILDAKKER